jgi:hypothetical protein
MSLGRVPSRSIGSAGSGNEGNLAFAYFGFTLVCQLVVGLSFWPSARVAFRTGPFLASILMLFLVRGTQRSHPARAWAILALVITWLMLLNPVNGGAIAALAEAGLSTAVLAPLFWATRLRIDRHTFVPILVAWWLFHAASAALGILQLYWPELFAFQLSDELLQQGPGYVDAMSIIRPDGVSVFRPMGLTDVPGGAAISGLYVLVAGTALAMNARRLLLRIGVCLSMLTGAACIFVCQIRAVVIVTMLCLGLMIGLLLLRGEMARAKTALLGLGAVMLAGFIWAVSAGGSSVRERLDTLAEDSPAQVYYKNRGRLLEQTFLETLPEYPLGAGLGRWGTMNRYFGDQGVASDLYAEVQWTGWGYDGGIPLVAANGALLLAALLFAFRLATRSRDGDSIWVVAIFVLNCGVVALSFGSAVFATQSGIDFWLLNGLLTALAPAVLIEREGAREWNLSSSPRTSSRLAGWTGRT